MADPQDARIAARIQSGMRTAHFLSRVLVVTTARVTIRRTKFRSNVIQGEHTMSKVELSRRQAFALAGTGLAAAYVDARSGPCCRARQAAVRRSQACRLLSSQSRRSTNHGRIGRPARVRRWPQADERANHGRDGEALGSRTSSPPTTWCSSRTSPSSIPAPNSPSSTPAWARRKCSARTRAACRRT